MSSVSLSVQELRKAMKGNGDDDATKGVVVAKSNKRSRGIKSEFTTNYINFLQNLSKSDMTRHAEKLIVDMGTPICRVPTQVTDSDEEQRNSGSKIKRSKYFDADDYDDDANKREEDEKSDEIGNNKNYPVQVEDSDDNDCDDVDKYRKDVIDMVDKSATGAGRSAVRRVIELLMSASTKTITSLRTLLQRFPSWLVVLAVNYYFLVSVVNAKSLGKPQHCEMGEDLANLLLWNAVSAVRIYLSALPYNVSGVGHVSGCRFLIPPQNSTVCNDLNVQKEGNYMTLSGNSSILSSLYQIVVKEGGKDRMYNQIDCLLNCCILNNETLNGTSNGDADLVFDINLPNNTCTVGKTVTRTSASNIPAVDGSGNDYGMWFWIAFAIIAIIAIIAIVFAIVKMCCSKVCKKQSYAVCQSGNSEH